MKGKKQLGRKSPHPVEFQIMVAKKVHSGEMTYRAGLFLQNLMLKKAMKYALEKKSAGSSGIASENLAEYQGDVE